MHPLRSWCGAAALLLVWPSRSPPRPARWSVSRALFERHDRGEDRERELYYVLGNG